mgnify:CR=1 FL=1
MDRIEIPTNFTESTTGPTMVDHHIPAMKVVLQGQEVTGCIINGGSRVNVISKATCSHLDITKWEPCPFWLHMEDTRSIRSLGLVRKLKIVIGGHGFEIAVAVLALAALGAYPILSGRPWLCSASIKQNWQYNCISFRRGRAMVRVPTQEIASPIKAITPLYAEEVNMLKGLDETELEVYLDENPGVIPLFEIDVIETTNGYVASSTPEGEEYEPDPELLLDPEFSAILSLHLCNSFLMTSPYMGREENILAITAMFGTMSYRAPQP